LVVISASNQENVRRTESAGKSLHLVVGVLTELEK